MFSNLLVVCMLLSWSALHTSSKSDALAWWRIFLGVMSSSSLVYLVLCTLTANRYRLLNELDIQVGQPAFAESGAGFGFDILHCKLFICCFG